MSSSTFSDFAHVVADLLDAEQPAPQPAQARPCRVRRSRSAGFRAPETVDPSCRRCCHAMLPWAPDDGSPTNPASWLGATHHRAVRSIEARRSLVGIVHRRGPVGARSRRRSLAAARRHPAPTGAGRSAVADEAVEAATWLAGGHGRHPTRPRPSVPGRSTSGATGTRTRPTAGPTISKRLRLAAESLGPTYIKLGQIISSGEGLFPAELVEEFKKCRDQVPAEPFEVVKLTVEQDLGARLDDIFESFDETPLAAASIAQVHAAVLPHRRVGRRQGAAAVGRRSSSARTFG